jgi:SET domain-containing protein
MFLIKTYLDKSNINGIGVFANEDIFIGTKVWQDDPDIDIVIDQEKMDILILKLGKKIKGHLSNPEKNVWVGSFDVNTWFVNHSDDSNVKNEIAIREIKKGEEITVNYYEYCLSAKECLT